jgi:hypothetical protein
MQVKLLAMLVFVSLLLQLTYKLCLAVVHLAPNVNLTVVAFEILLCDQVSTLAYSQ